MSALALANAGLPVPWRLRGQQLFAQPAVRRSLPLIAVVGALLVAALMWLAFRSPDMRPVWNGLAEADKAAVADALRTGNFRVDVDPATGAVEVPADQVAAARIMLAGQGLPKAVPSGSALLTAMPLGTSRAVEGAQLKAAQEHDLAASIAAIDAVESAQVHLATPEPSVFIRDRAAPSASVFITLASGRTLSDAQVRAIVHLVASSVPGLDPDAVSVVDQSGTLLSGSGSSGELGETGRMLDAEPSKLEYVELDNSFTSNLTDTGRYLQLRIAVSTTGGPPVVAALAQHKLAIVSTVLAVLGDLAEVDVADGAAKTRLKIKLRGAIEGVLQQKARLGGIDEVFLTSLVVQ